MYLRLISWKRGKRGTFPVIDTLMNDEIGKIHLRLEPSGMRLHRVCLRSWSETVCSRRMKMTLARRDRSTDPALWRGRTG